jgi:hypothetical protein
MTNARGVARAVYLLAYAGPVIQGIPVDPVGAPPRGRLGLCLAELAQYSRVMQRQWRPG